MLNLEDVERNLDNLQHTQGVLTKIIEETEAHGAFLVDSDGFLVAEAGDIEIDRVALAALIAASFGATAEIARIMGESDFDRLTHQGKTRSLFIGKAGKRHILIVIFGRETNLGLVKLYAENAATQLGDILDGKVQLEASKNKIEAQADESKDEDNLDSWLDDMDND